MVRVNKSVLLISTALGMAMTGPGLALAAAPPQDASASSAAPQARDPRTAELEDVIVTARRTDERLQDVPISITVFNQAQLSERNVTDANDLALYTPSLSTTGTLGKENAQYAIRGFVQEKATTASVGVYFADVVAPRAGTSVAAGDGAGPGSFFDLQNVQVLKGPQGTLFGRNTTGGAVLLVPVKPSGQYEGYVQGLYGDYNWIGLQGVVNLPLADNVRARLAADYQDRDGYTEVVGGPSLDDRHYLALRGSLVVDLTSNLENYTIASYTKSETNGSAAVVTQCNPLFLPLGDLQCGSGNAFQQQQALGPRRVSQFDHGTYNEVDQRQIINTTTWTASDNLTIKNIISYTQLKTDYRSEVFGGGSLLPASINVNFGAFGTFPIPTGALAGTPIDFVDVYPARGLHTNDQDTFTEELQFQGQTENGRLTWQAGGYYESSKPLNPSGTLSNSLASCSDLATLQCFDPIGLIYSGAYGLPVPVGGAAERITEIEYQNLGIYAQGTYTLTDKLKVTGGLRYTWDEVKGASQVTRYQFFAPNTPVASCLFLGASLANNCRIESEVKSEKPTWLIDFDYTPNEDVLLYAKYARGYRQGSVSPDAAEGYQTFGPEQVDTYEIGAKTSFRSNDVAGTFNISTFYNDFKDQQLSATFTPDPLSGVAQADGIVNAGKSRIYGAELSLVLRYLNFDLTADYTYLNTELLEISPIVLDPASIYKTASPTGAVGRPLIFSPENKFSVNAGYTLPVDERIGTIRLSATYTYTGSQYSNVSATYGQLDSYGLLNLNLDWRNIGGSDVDLSIFATNITDELYAVYSNGLYDGAGIESTRYGEPRMYGLKLRYSFGG